MKKKLARLLVGAIFLSTTSAFAQTSLAPSPAESTPSPPSRPDPIPLTGRWDTRFYGFGEIDVMHDSTQAYNDLGGWTSTAIPRDYTYAGSRGRTQFTARNSRIGFVLGAPPWSGMTATATAEGDFMGNQPGDVSESAFLTFGTFRMRVFSLRVETDYVDVLVGQTWSLFSSPFFWPASTFLLPVPGETFKRDVQFRISRTLKSHPINAELGISANRPPQRDSEIPDLQAGLRVSLNGWKGVHTPGLDGQRIVGASLDPLTLGVSAAGRRFRVSNFEGTPAGTAPDPRFSNSADGYAIVADAMIPVIPASSLEDHAHALTLTAQFSKGTGYADLLGGLVANAGGPATPSALYPAVPGSPDRYVPNIQPGLVVYDSAGNLHTIKWSTFLAGVQYYLPPSGKVFVSGNYAEARSDNAAKWADVGQLPYIFTKTRYFDANLFWDMNPLVRVGTSYQYLKQTFANGDAAHNVRLELSVFFWL
jgi:hypothetical protein